ncbi:MAG: S8 family serine peptidase [Candidatus Lokiarchaeota archaeon]|nr:S8 family serine peptidase [Candidatus Harpocratesius repetitus]
MQQTRQKTKIYGKIFRKQVNIFFIFLILMIPGLFLHFQSPAIQNNNFNFLQMINKSTPNSLKTSTYAHIDPRLADLIKNNEDPYKKVNVLLFFSDKPVKYSELSKYGTIQISFTLLKGCKFETTLSHIEKLGLLPYIQSIWWDLPIPTSIPSSNIIESSSFSIKAEYKTQSTEFVNFTNEINANQLWQRGISGKGVVIALLDTGIDISGSGGGNLDDLDDNSSTNDPKFLGGVSMVPDEPLYYTDLTGRGTFHAGIACGTAGLNPEYIGVAPDAKYLNVKIFDSLGITYWSFMISGIEWAIEHGADIILFVATIPGLYLDPVCQIVNAAVDRGVIVITPVGDDGPSYMSVNTPGQANQAISVGAYNSITKEVWEHSSRGPSYDFHVGPDVIAPGVDLIGPRARYLTNESIELAVNFITQISPEMTAVLNSQLNSLQAEFDTLSNSIPKSPYGTPLSEDSSFTRASGTGAAAAVCAGGVALLLNAFPLATPVIIQQALMRGAHSISFPQDINSEGSGLIDLLASYSWLQDFYKKNFTDFQSSSVPLFYSGMITNEDLTNVSQYSTDLNYSQIENTTFSAFMSSQMMSSALVINTLNESNPLNVQNISIHLPLNQFGVGYSLSGDSEDFEFHWLSEFKVVKEMHEMVNTIVYPDGYRRYVSILEFNGLYIACLVETWAYIGEKSDTISTFNFTSPLTGESYQTGLNFSTLKLTHRLNAFKFSFHFMNERKDHQSFRNLTLISFIKGDLFVNETGTLDNLNYKGFDAENTLEFMKDDIVIFDSQSQMMWVEDFDNSSNLLNNPRYAAIGFVSSSHNLSSFAVGNSFNILLNISQAKLANSTWNSNISKDVVFSQKNSTNSLIDPSFAQLYSLNDLEFGTTSEFNGVMSISQANSISECRDIVKSNAELLQTNTTNYNVTDLIVFSASFSRIHEPHVPYQSSVKILNLGNQIIPNTQLVFYSNRTVKHGESEIYSRIISIQNLQPFNLKSYNTSWIPLDSGIYQIGWILGDMDQFSETPSITDLEYLLFQNPEITDYREMTDSIDVNYLSNILFRNIFIINASLLENKKISTFLVSPFNLDIAPMQIYTPLDYAVYNLSILAIRDINNIEISTDGLGKRIVQFMEYSLINTPSFSLLSSKKLNLHTYNSIPLILFGNPLIPPGQINFNITFRLEGESQPFYSIPVSFQMSPTRGRVWFDATHLNFFRSEKISNLASLTSFGDISKLNLSAEENFGNFNDILKGNFDISSIFDLNERLDTTWGNYYDLHSSWANPTSNFGKGALVSTILPFLDLNLSQFFDFSQFKNESESSNEQDYFFNTQDLLPETSFLGDSIGNYKFENEIISTTIINHDLLQFFDVLVINDPEQAFTKDEMDDIYDWVDSGGTLFVWSEDYLHSNLESLNNLLDEFGLKFANSSFYPYDTYKQFEGNDGLCYLDFSASDKISSLFQSTGFSANSIALRDPIEIFSTKSDSQILGYKTMFDGEHGVIGLSTYGKGKVFAIGDSDIFKRSYLSKADNSKFAQQLIQWGLSKYYNMKIEITPSILPFSTQGFVDISFSNFEYMKERNLFSNGFLFLGLYFDSNGNPINASIYGIETPLLPLFETEPGHYDTFFDTKWINQTGIYYILLIIDHPAAVSEISYLSFNVVEGPPSSIIQQYQIPNPSYPHYIDIIGVFGIILMMAGLYYYNQQKSKTRLKIIPLQGDYLNLAKTRLYEGETLLKLMLRGIKKTDVEEIERLRFLLSNQKRVIKFFKDLNKFGETIGEHY